MNNLWRQTFNGSKTYAISDCHLNHENLCKGTSKWLDIANTRDYNTLDEMNFAVINSINERLDEDCDLFNLGDFLFGDKSLIGYWLSQIKCKNHYYLFGNHCEWMRNKPEVLNLFTWVGDYLEIFFTRKPRENFTPKKKLICMSHYPFQVWNENNRNSYMAHGHNHGNLNHDNDGKILDCGWDCFKRPLSLWEVDEILSKKQFIEKDHHDKNL